MQAHGKKLFSTIRQLPKSARIVEVGLRDGLQNESKLVTLETKLKLLNLLYSAGLRSIEAGSFVSPKWVPQMKDTPEIFQNLLNSKHLYPGATFSALTPNIKGLETALELGVEEVAIFGAASESFSQKNINCSIAESLKRFESVCTEATKRNVKVRGYVSCVLGCPYEGSVNPAKVTEISKTLLEMGCYEISLGDTIGVGNVGTTKALLDNVVAHVPREKLAVHFHNTYGQALSNIFLALQYGINIIDSSISGLGGCPYAKGASGNVPTEDVVYMLNGLGIETNTDMSKLLEASKYIDEQLQRKSESKVALALRAKH